MIEMVGYYTVAGLLTPAAQVLKEAGTRMQIRALPHFDGVVEPQYSSVVMEVESLRVRSAYESVGVPVTCEGSAPQPAPLKKLKRKGAPS